MVVCVAVNKSLDIETLVVWPSSVAGTASTAGPKELPLITGPNEDFSIHLPKPTGGVIA